MSRVTAEQLKAALRGRWPDVLAREGVPSEILDPRKHFPCPKCGGNDRFRAFNDFADTGGVMCSHCHSDESGDGIATLMWWLAVDFPTAFQRLCDHAGLSAPPQPLRRGDADTLNRGYTALLDALKLSRTHKRALLDRGFSEDDIQAGGYRTLTNGDRTALAEHLQRDLGDDYELVPGFTRKKGNPIPVQPGMAIPCRNVNGLVGGVRIRRDGNVGNKSRYVWMSSAPNGGIVAEACPHVPPFGGWDTETVRLTEGEIKAHLATKLSGVLSLSFPGVGSWATTIPLLQQLGAKVVLLAFDADAASNLNVARALQAAYTQLSSLGYEVKLESWLIDDGKGIDDLLVAGKTPIVLAGDLAVNEVTRIFRAATGKHEAEKAENAPPPDEGEAPPDEPPGKPTVRNAWLEFYQGDGGETKQKLTPIPMREVIQVVQQATDNWPRRVNAALFIDDRESSGGVSWLKSQPSLFGWLASQAGIIDWHRGRGCVTKDEVFNELQRTAKRYAAVEMLPHEPKIDGHYYACPDPVPGDGTQFRTLLDFFCPATDVDRDLIQAAFMTCFWGGRAGKRPIFVFTTDDGPGAGKSTVAQIIGELAGGLMSFDRDEEVSQIKTRLLTVDALPKRIAIIDNVKTLKLSWGELEGLVTAESISGKQMYVGEGSRPNTITWFITLNGANLGTDIAKRAVVVKVRKPDYSPTWEDDVRGFVAEHRAEIIADIIGLLRSSVADLDKFTRWGPWEGSVLRRLPDPHEAQRVIAERQIVADAEQEENEVIEEHIAEALEGLDYTPARQNVFLPLKVITPWFNVAANTKYSTTNVARLLRRMCAEGRLRRILESKSHKNGRGFVWYGEKAEGCEVQTDVESRMNGSSTDNRMF